MKDEKMAYKYYMQAVDQGHDGAQRAIDTLNNTKRELGR